MRGGACARRTELHFIGIGLRVGDEFLEVLGRQILAHEKGDRNVGDQRDRREVGQRIIERLLVHRLALRLGADGAEEYGVAVRLGIGRTARAGHAARATDIFNNNGLAEQLAHLLRHDAAEHVGRAARGERDDHGHRAIGKCLRGRGAGQRQYGR